MINKDDLVSLSWEQKKKYRSAINYGYFDDYERNPRQWKHTFVGTYIWKHPDGTRIIGLLSDIIGHLPTWEDMTETVIRDFVRELSESGNAQSSVRVWCAQVKAVLNSNYKEVPCDRHDFSSILSVKGAVSQAIYLNRDEMKLIIRYKPITELENFVHRNFVVAMLTGARRVDAERLSMNNCDMTTGMLSYVPKKTPGIVVNVPIDERNNLRYFLLNKRKRDIFEATFNDTIRSICRKCGINNMITITRRKKTETKEKWEFVSSHTARRSFATNLFLAGISLEDIAMMMGHGTNIETTKRYICAERKVTNTIAAYFKPERKRPDSVDAYSYNKGVDDVLKFIIKREVIAPDGLTARSIEDMKLSVS